MRIPFASLTVKSYLTSFKGTCVLSAKLMPKFTLLPGWISAGSHLSVTAYFPLEVFLSSGGFGTSPVAVMFGCPAPTFKRDRKSTRLNSSHVRISYAVFCLKKKKRTECELIDVHYHHVETLMT